MFIVLTKNIYEKSTCNYVLIWIDEKTGKSFSAKFQIVKKIMTDYLNKSVYNIKLISFLLKWRC